MAQDSLFEMGFVMAGKIRSRLEEVGIDLPAAPSPVANYAPWISTSNLIFVSGQLPFGPTGIITGKVGIGLGLTDAVEAARHCAIGLIAQLEVACEGDLDRVRQVVKLTGFVNCSADFSEHPVILNGASDLFADIFGEAGRHARSAVGVSSLPFGAAVEVDGIFAID